MTRHPRAPRWLDRPPGNWRPARLDDTDIIHLVVILGVAAMIRGFDYLVGLDETSRTLTLIERTAPLWAWGALAAVGAVTLLAGAYRRCHAAVWVGHVILSGTYGLLGLGILLGALGVPWADGIRGGTALVVISWLHSLLSRRMGIHPIDSKTAKTQETVEGSA